MSSIAPPKRRPHKGCGPTAPLHSKESAESAFRSVSAYLTSLPAAQTLRQIDSYRCAFDAIEAQVLADNLLADGDERVARNMLDNTRKSKRDQRGKLKRAKTLQQNPGLGDKLASGELTGEHLDVLAKASQQSEGHAARANDLIDKMAATTPDQAARLADDWVAKHSDANDVACEHDRQRQQRNVHKSRTISGLGSITLSGDAVSIDAMWSQISALADRFYRSDGGRLAHRQHPRSDNQRRYDAAFELITNQQGMARTSASRPNIVITLDADNLDALPTQLGVGPISEKVLQHHWCNANLIGAVFGANGEPLWLGRKVRTASNAQLTALTARDTGCVLCRADHRRCEAHHLTPYNAPAQGKTDIDQLALVCGPCHRHLHDAALTLEQTSERTWATRPATRDEIAPRRPQRK